MAGREARRSASTTCRPAFLQGGQEARQISWKNSSALLQIGNLNSGSQPGADAPAKPNETPEASNLNLGSQSPIDQKMFLKLPEELKVENNVETGKKIEGNR